MHKYHFTTKAVEDLTAIWNYSYQQHSEEHADDYYQLLLESCREIAANPNLDISYGSICPELRGVRISHYIIFYRRIADGQIETLRILRTSIDLKHPEGMTP